MSADVESALRAALAERILVLDGAMGTQIQQHKLEERDFRGDRFVDHPRDLKGNNDLLVLTRPDLPKIASKDRLKGTPEEYQAVVQGSLAHFGTYSVNEAEGTYTLHVESSTYPNYNGTDQIRIVTSLSRDEMKVTNPSPTTPTKSYVVYKRL